MKIEQRKIAVTTETPTETFTAPSGTHYTTLGINHNIRQQNDISNLKLTFQETNKADLSLEIKSGTVEFDNLFISEFTITKPDGIEFKSPVLITAGYEED